MSDPVLDITKYINSNTTPDFEWLRMTSDNAGQGTLYMLDMPPTPDRAMAVFRYEGAPPIETFGNPVLIRRPRLQIQIRDKRSDTALAMGELLIKFLAPVKDQVINGTTYSRIKPVGEPSEIGPDSSGRQRAVVNFVVEYYDSI